ncbi:DarT ssDNA thymidine ADP-ribosyltransferase family protein [Marinobacter algicola]|uniref:DarT ssDNA thymidine ADP-ribosyltransferase family protein n=1 Tax=Marinobacter algicola TaxID=236100 RepID=UPI000A056646|nr:DarT ssDNA thymidine ADP-ribosyltransferase family protein [Marinobacter algicola]
MSQINEIISNRKITGLYHFTTNNGILGILASHGIYSRKSLPKEKYLEYIVKYNATERKYDSAWLDYVNLSISRVNSEFFSQCNGWHPDVWWCVLEIEPEIMAHDNVYFSTTNNIYPATRRAKGPAGLEALFSELVLGRYSAKHYRTDGFPQNYTTDVQAEVLYPKKVPLERLKRILVLEDEHQDVLMGQQEALDLEPRIPVVVDPDVLPRIARA